MASNGLIMDSFLLQETEHTLEDVGRTVYALHMEVESLDMTVKDWAAWNATYLYITGQNPGFIEAELGDSTIANIRMDMVFLFHSDLSLAFAKVMDVENGMENHELELFIESISINAGLFQTSDRDSRTAGLMSTTMGALLFSSRPIQDSSRAMPTNGTLLMGRFLNSSAAERLSNAMFIDVSLHPLNGLADQDCVNALDVMLAEGVATHVATLDENTVAGYAILNDFTGAPLLVLRIKAPRTIYQHGLDAYYYFQIFLLAVMVVMGIVTMVILETMMLRRMSQLSTEVNLIGLDPDHAARVQVTGNDEMSNLASNINSMLDLRGRYETQQVDLNSRLNMKVAELENYKRLTVNRELRMEELKTEMRSMKAGGDRIGD